MIKRLISYIVLCISLHVTHAQVSPDCATAIPICSNVPITGEVNGLGIDDFNGELSLGKDCLRADYGSSTIESNSAWYRFRTSESGQLGFNIRFENGDDWDFALFKAGSCDNLGDPVRCNFFDNTEVNGYTGIGVNPITLTQTVQYDDWLDVEAGDEYYLLINNFSNRNLGFSIQFSGQIFQDFPDTALDCSIFDSVLGPPRFLCDTQSSELLDVSFVRDAVEYFWYEKIGNGFQEITGEKSAMLSVNHTGTYRVVITRIPGLDDIVSEVTVTFTETPVAVTPSNMDVCDDDIHDGITYTDLTAKDVEVLGTQSNTDFRVSYHLSASDAQKGDNPISKNYENTTGPYHQQIFVRIESVFNPDCYDASQSFELNVHESPDVTIDTTAFLCLDTGAPVLIGDTNSIINPAYSYLWDNGETTPTIDVTMAGTYKLTITNTASAFNCSVTKEIVVNTSETPVIGDPIIEDLQSNNKVTVVVSGSGDYEFQLDNGSFQDSPVFTHVAPGAYRLTVRDKNGCGSANENILVIGFMPFFTPNGDHANDLWEISGITTLTQVKACIYDRYGKPLKEITKLDRYWDGTYNGTLMPSSDYWIRIEYTRNKDGRAISGTVVRHFTLKR